MRPLLTTLAALFVTLAWAEVRAETGKTRPAKAAVEEDEAADDVVEEAEAPRSRKKGKKADGKSVVEEHLRERLSAVQKNWDDQKMFGSKLTKRWEKFFAEIYEDRKRFETSIARQRLNLFETMASVGPSYQAQGILDFERMQNTMLKSFDASQKEKMDEFFGRLMEDTKGYALEQDKKRSEMVAISMEAWKDQKAVLGDKPEKGREKE